MEDALFQDPEVQKLHQLALHGTEEEKKEAKERIDAIFKARNTIARAQVAYSVYKAFRNTYLMQQAHKEAMKQREILKGYDIDEELYGADVNISEYFKGSALEACSYDPSMQIVKDGKFVPILMPEDNQYQYLLGLVLKGGAQGAWAQKQVDEIHKQLGEIGRAQVAWHEYKAKGMTKEMDGAHTYAEKVRGILKGKYALSTSMVDGVGYMHLWAGAGPAGNKLRVQETSGFNTSGDPKLKSNPKYSHSRELTLQINKIDEQKFGNSLKSFTKIYEQNKELYERIAKKTGIPPQLVAAIHYRESTGNFNTYLHNGEKLGRTTTKKPVGIYFDNFEEAAVHALSQSQFTSLRDAYGLSFDSDDLIAMLTFAEAYNGWGYFKNNRVSPYVYSGTNLYKKGKYKSDGVYDPNLVDAQPGVYILINAITTVKKTETVELNSPKKKENSQGTKVSFESNVKSALDALEEKPSLKKGAVTIPNLQNLPLYVQGDKRYGKELIGKQKTMSQIGCTTTALAAVNAWNTYDKWAGNEEPHPGRYNDTVKYDSSGNIYWDSTEITRPLNRSFKYGDSKFEELVKTSVDKGRPVIFAVNGGEHWMVAVGYSSEGTVIVYNPADGSLSTTKEINEKRSARGKRLYKTIDRIGEM